MKKFAIVIIITIILAVAIFAVVYTSTNSHGIDKISTYDAFREYADSLQVGLDDAEPEKVSERKDKTIEQLESPMFSEVCVFEITAGNAYMQKGSMYLQDAVVKNVIKGDAAMAGKNMYLAKMGGIVDKEDLGKVCIDTSTCVNVMMPEENYLVFCAKSEASDVVDGDIPLYELVFSKFAQLRIDKDDIEAVSNYGEKEADDKHYADYKAYAEQEFFVISKDTLLEYNKIKHEILEKYGVE